jgi:acyl carrier protein
MLSRSGACDPRLVLLSWIPKVRIADEENVMEQERVQEVVYRAIDSMNSQLPDGAIIEKSTDAPLYGGSSSLESLEFVTLIMEVEEKVRDEFGVELTIADENLLSKEKSPFTTVGNLTKYLTKLLNNP